MSLVRPAAAALGAALVLSAVALVAVAGPALAHVRESMGYSTVRSDAEVLRYELSLEYDILARAVDLGEGSRDAAGDDAREGALERGRAALAGYLDERVVVHADDVACEQALDGSSLTTRDATPYAVLHLRFDCSTGAGSAGAHRISYDVFRPSDAVTDDHRNVVDYRIGPDRGRAVLSDGENELVVGESSAWATGTRFARMGVEHILSGLDHVLFVVALAIGATTLRRLVGVVTTFTVAHSLTLAAALLGWVHVPAEVVEPLIALSIAFVALDNLIGVAGPARGNRSVTSRARLPVIFAFGLLHGLGFAGALRVDDEVTWGLVGSLVSFNLGIEVGQALLLAALVPLLVLVRRRAWSAPILRVVTGVVAALGLFWFGERFWLDEARDPLASLLPPW